MVARRAGDVAVAAEFAIEIERLYLLKKIKVLQDYYLEKLFHQMNKMLAKMLINFMKDLN